MQLVGIGRARIQGLVTDLFQGKKGKILLVISAGWFLSIGVRYTYPALLPFFQESFDLSLTEASLLVSILWISYAIGQFPGGILGDRLGEGNVLVISTLLSVIGIIAVAASNTVYILISGTIAFGVATALFGPTRVSIFTDLYAERAGAALGFTMAAGSVGNAALPILATLVASYASWRLGFAALIPIFVLITIALLILVPSRTSKPMAASESMSLDSLRKLVLATRRNGIPAVLLTHVIASFVNQGFIALYPVYLVSIKGLTPSVGATLYGLYFAIGVAIQPLAGTGRDRFGPKAVLITLLSVYALSLLALPLADGVIALGFLTLFLSARNGVGVITNTYISTALPEDIKGSGLGLLRTVWILIGATSPAIVGFFADAGHFEEVIFALAILAGSSALTAILVPRS